jgi:hypothetical protein
MYIYKYYVETDNEESPVYDLEFTVRYTMFDGQIEVSDERITKVVFLETKEIINDRELEDKLYNKYSKPWDELEAELWEDYTEQQNDISDYYD